MTTPITTIDASSHARILAEAKAALAAALAPYGLTIKQEGTSTRDAAGTYAMVKYSITVAAPVTADGITRPVGAEAVAFTRYAASEGLDPAWLGQTLRDLRYGDLQIVGFRAKARKNPVIVKQVATGKGYVYPVDGIKELARRAGWALPAHWSNDPKYIGLANGGLL